MPGDMMVDAPRSSPSQDASAPRVPGFTLDETLGQGGFANVWAAQRVEGGEPSAIKIAHAKNAIVVERFRREASVLARVGAPHVPRFHRLGRLDDGRPYLAMERR